MCGVYRMIVTDGIRAHLGILRSSNKCEQIRARAAFVSLWLSYVHLIYLSWFRGRRFEDALRYCEWRLILINVKSDYSVSAANMRMGKNAAGQRLAT